MNQASLALTKHAIFLKQHVFYLCLLQGFVLCLTFCSPRFSSNFPQVFCWIQIRQHTCSGQRCQTLFPNSCLTLKAFFNHYHAGISLDCLLHMFCTHVASYHIWPDITIMSAQGHSTLSVLKKTSCNLTK